MYRSRIPPIATQVRAGVGCNITSKEIFGKILSNNKYPHSRMARKDVSEPISTDCIAIEKENSMCQAVLLLHYVEWMGAIKVSISL